MKKIVAATMFFSLALQGKWTGAQEKPYGFNRCAEFNNYSGTSHDLESGSKLSSTLKPFRHEEISDNLAGKVLLFNKWREDTSDYASKDAFAVITFFEGFMSFHDGFVSGRFPATTVNGFKCYREPGADRCYGVGQTCRGQLLLTNLHVTYKNFQIYGVLEEHPGDMNSLANTIKSIKEGHRQEADLAIKKSEEAAKQREIFAAARRRENNLMRGRPAGSGPPAVAYVANAGSNDVSVINTNTNMIVATIPVGKEPRGIAVSDTISRAYVTHTGSDNVSVINTSSKKVVGSIDVGTRPFGVAMSTDGSRVYVANQISANVSVIDTSTNTVVATITIPNGIVPSRVAVGNDGSRAYVTNSVSNFVSVIDTSTNRIVTTIGVNADPIGIAISDASSWAYVASESFGVSVIDTSMNTVVKEIDVGNRPFDVAVSDAISRAYVANLGSNNVSVIDTSTNTVVAIITVGTNPFAVEVNVDGSRAYVANSGSNNVSVIDTSTNTVVAIIPVGRGPRAIAMPL